MAWYSALKSNVALGYNKILGRVAPSLTGAVNHAKAVSAGVTNRMGRAGSIWNGLPTRARRAAIGGAFGAAYGMDTRDSSGRRGNLGRGLGYGVAGALIGGMMGRGNAGPQKLLGAGIGPIMLGPAPSGYIVGGAGAMAGIMPEFASKWAFPIRSMMPSSPRFSDAERLASRTSLILNRINKR